mgnify:CR=1 FL=1
MLDDALLATLRLSTHRGRPLGSDGFLSKLETLLEAEKGTLLILTE